MSDHILPGSPEHFDVIIDAIEAGTSTLAELRRVNSERARMFFLDTQHDEHGQPTVRYEPWTGDGTCGFRIIDLPTGAVEYLYFNPSDNQDGTDVPNVFVYHGPTGDPAQDTPVHHYLVLEEHREPGEGS